MHLSTSDSGVDHSEVDSAARTCAGTLRVSGTADRRVPPEAAAEELVSVVIPAHNAASTIDETLRSVRAQTHRALEIIVVDDGSTDETVRVVGHHLSADPRIQLIMQESGGVAAARNAGISRARGDFIAPVDADDLWHPDKIRLQLEAMRAGGPRMGLIYTHFAIIDAESRIVAEVSEGCQEGDVFLALCERNMVGNGSSALIRKAALETTGGYDSRLRAQRAQGCEDIKLYLQIAEKWTFGLVPQPLTGYRRLPGNMSSDSLQMVRSFDLVAGEFCSRRPELRERFHQAYNQLYPWLFRRTLASRRLGNAATLMRLMLAHEPTLALGVLASVPSAAAGAAIRKLVRRGRSEVAPAEAFHVGG
jgi:glycosyltransferase involved in cell wall biosynthesis